MVGRRVGGLSQASANAVNPLTVDSVSWCPVTPALLLQQGGFGSFVPILLMIGIFVLLVIMPARKRQKKLEKMLAELRTGDRVVTSGGLTGTVVGLTDGAVVLRIPPDGVKLEMARNAVVGMAEKPGK